jgi:murein DD-endopeptidase MepM/ murein hydrolase activator NlpD
LVVGRRLFGVVACIGTLVIPVVARADEAPTTTTSTSTTSTTVARATTTTSPALEFDPAKEPPADDAADEALDVDEAPPAYDGPVLNVNLSAATFDPRAAGAYQQWNQARAEVEALVVARSGRLADGERLRHAAVDARRAVQDAQRDVHANSLALRRYVVSVYVNPAMEPDRDSRAGEMVAQWRDVLVRGYARARSRVQQLETAATAAEQAAATANRFTATPDEDAAIAAGQAKVDALAAALRLYAVGDTGTPSGFRFPVNGEYRFSNSWGAPRMVGTKFAHAHQGVDVFASKGTPLVAVEPGTVVRRGSDRLGGLKLWLIGDSGYLYYYAHLDGFVPSVVEGTRVTAGQTVGFVGDTGNAKGGAPHVHFEVHVRGVAVNPYPLLVVAATGDPNRH